MSVKETMENVRSISNLNFISTRKISSLNKKLESYIESIGSMEKEVPLVIDRAKSAEKTNADVIK